MHVSINTESAGLDGQLLIASDYEILRSIVEKRRQRKTLRNNPAFAELARSMQQVSPRCFARVFFMGDTSTLPPFIPKLVARFSNYHAVKTDGPPKWTLKSSSSVAALSVRQTADGFLVEGAQSAVKNE